MKLAAGKKVYFASDFHLGLPDRAGSRERERLICRWLDEIRADAAAIYLVGDLFDVWFEYKSVVPKGYVRFLGKLAELKDAGIQIEVFTGNHDLWMQDYFTQEFGIPVHRQGIALEWNEKRFFVAHGDGLGPGDKGYKFLKKIMAHPFSQWLYRKLHPDWGLGIATYFSRKGMKHSQEDQAYQGDDKEWLMCYCREVRRTRRVDYFIFGHRHLALFKPVDAESVYVNLGDWLRYNSYAVFDGENLHLKYYNPDSNA